MDKLDLTFSINQHDEEGSSFDDCVLIHFGKHTILRFDNSEQLKQFGKDILGIYVEIKNNWEVPEND
jgi:hypothetical protein